MGGDVIATERLQLRCNQLKVSARREVARFAEPLEFARARQDKKLEPPFRSVHCLKPQYHDTMSALASRQ